MKLDDMFGEFRAEFDKLKAARAEYDRLSDVIDAAEEQHAQTIREISQAYAASCADAHTKRAEIKSAHEQALAANLAEQQRCQRQLRAIGPKIGPLVSSVVAGACGAGLPKDDDGNVVVELSTGEGDA
jgi:uncharacterized protein YdcH (DUF465 family)